MDLGLYLEAARAFDEDFYMPAREAFLVEEDLPLYRGERAWTFDEVQRGLPWAD